jgi:RNA polymerase sigma-70 factor (ECF subfamily)
MMNQLSDEQLMKHLAQGNKQAAGILYDRYHPKVFGYFVRQIRNQESSRDLTQNVFLKVIKYSSSWKDDKVFAYWLFHIARNILIDFHRAARHFYDIDEEPEIATRDMEQSIRSSEARESYDLLLDAMAKLPPGSRELIELNRFQGFSYKEIAATIDSTENAVKVKTFRAIQKLKEIYEKIIVE